MKMHVCLTTTLVLLSLALAVPAVSQNTMAGQKYVSVTGYDPNRNAEQDLVAALAEARRSGRKVLVEVGGKWCIWCRIMDDFFRQHPDMAELRDRNFVTVPVNFSPENENKGVLGRYPKVPGYPHLFVLDAEGKLLHSQNTSELEEGRGYNLTRFRSFLQKWAPGADSGKDGAGARSRCEEMVFSDVHHVPEVDDYVGTEIVLTLCPGVDTVSGFWNEYEGYNPVTTSLRGRRTANAVWIDGVNSEGKVGFVGELAAERLVGKLMWYIRGKRQEKDIELAKKQHPVRPPR